MAYLKTYPITVGYSRHATRLRTPVESLHFLCMVCDAHLKIFLKNFKLDIGRWERIRTLLSL